MYTNALSETKNIFKNYASLYSSTQDYGTTKWNIRDDTRFYVIKSSYTTNCRLGNYDTYATFSTCTFLYVTREKGFLKTPKVGINCKDTTSVFYHVLGVSICLI